MTVSQQLHRLLALGLADLAGLSPTELAKSSSQYPDQSGVILAIHPDIVPARRLIALWRRGTKPGFVAADLTDLEDFSVIPGVTIPDRPLYVIHDIQRGDDLRNWSPAEALEEITNRNRTPLTLHEGISWLLQEPKQLMKNYCFMTVGTRKTTGETVDSRTPAIWISGGTGRDGPENRGAPKVGWCWANNRHTWLGFAHAQGRS
ncbi:MAG: DUF5701 family protein [Angustibacter sp.]